MNKPKPISTQKLAEIFNNLKNTKFVADAAGYDPYSVDLFINKMLETFILLEEQIKKQEREIKDMKIIQAEFDAYKAWGNDIAEFAKTWFKGRYDPNTSFVTEDKIPQLSNYLQKAPKKRENT